MKGLASTFEINTTLKLDLPYVIYRIECILMNFENLEEEK